MLVVRRPHQAFQRMHLRPIRTFISWSYAASDLSAISCDGQRLGELRPLAQKRLSRKFALERLSP